MSSRTSISPRRSHQRWRRLATLAGSIGFLIARNPCLHAQTAPSTYSAYSGTDAKVIPPAPALGPANSVILDPTFGSRILRVTDANTSSRESFVSTDSGFHRSWNADSTAIKLTGPHGDGYWLEFDPTAFKVGNGTSRPTVHAVPFGANWEWSTVDPDIIYFLKGNQIAKYNKSTGIQTNLGGPPNGDPVAYTAVVVGQDNWVCAAAGPGVQNTYTEIYCINPTSPGTSKFINVYKKTINGVAQGDPNWPLSAAGQVIGIHDISGGTGSRWLEVTFHQANWGANGGAVLDLGTQTWSEITNADIYWGGHVSMGNGKYANSSGSVDGRDSRGMLLRNPDNAMNASQYVFVSQPPNTNNKWCDSDHSSWLNSMTNPNAPILVSRYMANTPNCAFAWTGEIYAAAVDGSNKVWRFAHNHDGGCYYGQGFAQISNDGHWALFSSYWDGTLGADTAFGCQTRIDTFIVDLLTSGAPPPPPPVIMTTSLPAATQSAAYTAALAVNGGIAPYTWSVSSGSLPTGVNIGASNGMISGTPTASGTATFTVQVTDASARTASRALSLTTTPGTIRLMQANATSGSTASVRIGFSAVNQPGNLIIAFVRMATATQTVSIRDTAGNAYVEAVSQTQTTDNHQIHVFYAKNIAAGSNTVTATFSGINSNSWLGIYEFSGLNPGAPLDQTAHAQGTSATASSGMTAATTGTNELIFAAIGMPSSYAGTATPASGYTLLRQNRERSRTSNEYLIWSGIGPVAGQFNLSSSTNWTAVVATFKQ